MKEYKFIVKVTTSNASEDEIKKLIQKDIGSWQGSLSPSEQINIKKVVVTKYRNPYNESNCISYLDGKGYDIIKHS